MRDHVIISFDHLNPPFAYMGEDQARGFSIELIRAAYAHERIDVTFAPADGPVTQLIRLAAGRADGAADITVTQRRRAWFAFSAHYHVEQLMIFGLRHGPVWPGFRHFSGKLAVKANSYVHEYLIRHHPRIPLITVESTEAEIEEVRSGRAGGFAATRETGMALIAAGQAPDVIAEGTPFGPAPLALAAMQDDDQRVIAPFNAGLDALVRAGEVDRLRAAWLIAGGHGEGAAL